MATARPPIDETPGRRFSREIRDALAAGASAPDLTLRLTLMDASKIKRDPAIELNHVSFSERGMAYLGVHVIEGGVRSSELMATDDIVVEPPPVVEAAKGQKKSTKEPRKPKAEKAEKAPAGKSFLTPPTKG